MFKRFCFAVLLLCLSVGIVSAQQVPSAFVPMQPCRILDTRLPAGSPPLTAGATYQIKVRMTAEELLEPGACGVPEEANSVFLTTIATGATSGGNVTIWASDLTAPASTSFNFRGNGTDSSATFSRLCAPPILECSDVDISYRVGFSNTHLVLDLVGYTIPLE